MRTRIHLAAAFLTVLLAVFLAMQAVAAGAEDPFQSHVRPTEPLSPEEERKAFLLPPGFEIQLVAAEPDILKPLNLAFDGRGRLWVTDTTEYPYPAKDGAPGRDTIKVLEDADGDGRAEKITTFADGLNIPIGLYPYRRGVVAFSIPNISYFEDTDGDGRADRREVLYGPFDTTRDTHGMNNSFVRGFDGWVYACHGFSNESKVQGKDGHVVRMQSGNIYRFRLDGSRIEQFAWGQVNPFGMAIDPLGDLYTADCHSKPLTLLLRGGYTESFGKPHDGLGFVPELLRHDHGSTAIAGCASYSAEDFPQEYRGSLFLGNVMTSRVHRDSLRRDGGTVRAKEEREFVTTGDPWFRPVDVRLGPDGALYIADFYNRIIGHYEVRLDHPGRDRRSGRIWRVVYRGEGSGGGKRAVDLTSAPVEKLIEALSSPNLTLRLLATDQLSDRIGEACVEPLRRAVASQKGSGGAAALGIHGLWALHRLGALDGSLLRPAAANLDISMRIHAQRILSETLSWTAGHREMPVKALSDPEGLVVRAAADAIGQHPAAEHVRPLLDALRSAPAADVHRILAIRIALRNQLRADGVLAAIRREGIGDEDRGRLATVLLAVPTPESAAVLLDHIQRTDVDRGALAGMLRHAARHVEAARIDDVAAIARKRVVDDLDLQIELIQPIHQGVTERGLDPTPGLIEWARALAGRLLDSGVGAESSWAPIAASLPSEGRAARRLRPWDLEPRASEDGAEEVFFLSSLPLGEKYTGAVRSRPFALPPKLSFFICGHLGFPEAPALPKNLARLRLEDTGEVLREALAPRSDRARRVEWDFGGDAGKRAYFEIADGLDLDAYAWVAVARFDPPVVSVPPASPAVSMRRIELAARLVETLKLEDLAPRLRLIIEEPSAEAAARSAAARALSTIEPEDRLPALARLVAEGEIPPRIERAVCEAVARRRTELWDGLLREGMKAAPRGLQSDLATRLAAARGGASLLLAMVAEGIASPRLLQNPVLRKQIAASGAAGSEKEAESRLDELTASLPPQSDEAQKLIEAKRRGFAKAESSAARGKAVFTKTCAPCHKIGGEGIVIGPQLDGIGNRGVERVLEDILDPNRNVDAAFGITTYILKDGQVLLGLFRREEGQAVVVADSTGKEITLPRGRIAREEKSRTSLMPESLVETIPPAEFFDLIAYLLSERSEPATPR